MDFLWIMIPQVDLFLFVFWRKPKAPKIYFEINWPLSTPVNALCVAHQLVHHFFKLRQSPNPTSSPRKWVYVFALIAMKQNTRKKVKLWPTWSKIHKEHLLRHTSGNALERVQRVHEPADVWDITFCTRRFWLFNYQKINIFTRLASKLFLNWIA